MPSPQPPLDSAPLPGWSTEYFIVRVRRSPGGDGVDLSGVVERLGTGEKRSFRSSQELAQVVAEWAD